ncbi:M28 family peptidase [Daejeonella lutea]|uniref:Carboxypeptidase Q n=1 Tax=Daejeonella lutea TaxID=572036 RepID=A0A1T5DDA1_9SPHI|nr:M28 family peptidase [Daejeonella lutea]SKB69702.1 Zn-dependent amino-or carboxypeptidase, M28 family [Daejeonella lutea]
MKFITTFIASLFLSTCLFAQNSDEGVIRQIYNVALMEGHTYKNLEHLCKQIGPRLSGSKNAQKAVDWSKRLMEDYGFDKVYLQEVMVPHWERGAKETAFIVDGTARIPVRIAALGGSIATSAEGVTAQIIEVKDFEQLKALGATVKGKIVFFNRPFDPRLFDTFDAYSGAVNQRGQGAVEAAKLGALGVIVRSMTNIIDDNPHTGGMRYQDGVSKIPAAAISTKAAELLSKKISEKGTAVKFYFKQYCRTLPDALSYNVIGEIRGSEKPENIITVGGHLDSWDLAEGAHDDGTGITQSIEVLRIFKSLNYQPKNTIRAVMFMNEENGLRGGAKYAELAKLNNEKHIAALESDEGGFTPRGFTVEDSPTALAHFSKWKPLLEPYKVSDIEAGGSGSDLGPLKTAVPGIVLIGFKPDSQRYFDIHHASSDVFENVNKRELELGAASIASMIYLIDKYGTK